MKRLIIYVVALFGACSLWAQSEELTMDRCVELALENNKQIKAAGRQTAGARHMMRSMRGNFFPDIQAYGTALHHAAGGSYDIPSFEVPVMKPSTDAQHPMLPAGTFIYFPGYKLNYELDNIYTWGVSFTQPVFTGGKIISGFKAARAGYHMAQQAERLTKTEVIVSTSEAYALLVKAGQMRQVARSYMEVVESIMKDVQNAYDHGLATKNDLLKVRVRLGDGELAVRKAENAHRLASMNLCHYIGRPLGEDICVSSKYPAAGPAGLEQLDITLRPEYAILREKEEIARHRMGVERAGLLPQVGVKGSYDYLNGAKVNDTKLIDKGGLSIVLNVKLPIFHFGERIGKMNAARAELLRTRYEREDLNEKMTLELAKARNNLEEAALEAEIADRNLSQAEENMRVSRRQYEVGMETLSDQLEAQTLWQQANETRVDAHFKEFLKYIEYLKAAGLLGN